MVGESDYGTKIKGWCAHVCEKWKEMKREGKTLKTKEKNKKKTRRKKHLFIILKTSSLESRLGFYNLLNTPVRCWFVDQHHV